MLNLQIFKETPKRDYDSEMLLSPRMTACSIDRHDKLDVQVAGFRPVMVKETIHNVLTENLVGREYVAEETTDLTKNIGDEIKSRLKDMGYDRYKFIVQVVIGEQRGEGVKMGCRCFWDSDTDNFAQDIFMNDSLFCVAAAFGVFYY